MSWSDRMLGYAEAEAMLTTQIALLHRDYGRSIDDLQTQLYNVRAQRDQLQRQVNELLEQRDQLRQQLRAQSSQFIAENVLVAVMTEEARLIKADPTRQHYYTRIGQDGNKWRDKLRAHFRSKLAQGVTAEKLYEQGVEGVRLTYQRDRDLTAGKTPAPTSAPPAQQDPDSRATK